MKKYRRLLILAMCVSTTVDAGGKLTCPASVKAGTTLAISATFTNDNPVAFPISDTVVSLIGNSGGAIGLQGPFVSPNTSSVPSIPAATFHTVNIPYGNPNCLPGQTLDSYGNSCFYTQQNITPGTVTISNLLVVNKVPAGMAGTLIAVTAGVLDSSNSTKNNQLKMSGVCAISVTH